MKDTDIIIFALPRWDGKYASTSFSMASELAKAHRVFYVDNPFTIKDFIRKFRTKQIRRRIPALLTGDKQYLADAKLPRNLIVVTPQLVLPVNFLPPGRLYNFISRINNKIVSKAINRCIADHGITQYIYINSFNPFYDLVPSALAPEIFVYQCVDNIGEHAYVSKHGPRLESTMVGKADVVLVTSRELYRLKKEAGSKVWYLPNAADASIFKQIANGKKPADVPEGYCGIIGYVGNIDPRLDYALLVRIARRFPLHLLLIVGPKTFDEYKSFMLEELPNVCFVGAKPYQDLPMYLGAFDCAIIPFKCNAATRSIYPLKVNEYLAGGKPVVSTDFSDDIRDFRHTISIAETHESFLDLIEIELNSDSDKKKSTRVRVADGNTWQARVDEFWKILEGREKQ